MNRMVTAATFAALLISGTAFAQTPPAAAPAAPAATAPAMGAASMDKKAKSKECSMEADKQGLHGKARKTFRSKCKSGKA